MISLPRNAKVRAWLFQAALVGGIVATLWLMTTNAQQALEARDINTGFGFLAEQAGFTISESVIPFSSESSVGRAFLAGLANTMAVSIAAIVLATFIGVVVGIARLAPNRLISGAARIYVEVFRNTPQLVQIIFWYALLISLPNVRNAFDTGFGALLSNRGLAFPWLADPVAGNALTLALGVGFLGGLILLCLPGRRRWRGKVILMSGIGLPLAAFVFTGFNTSLSFPELSGFNIKGGRALSPEFLALFLGLGLYIAAFVAEIIRAGLNSVDKGQVEAAEALGLPPGRVLSSIRIPQALRVIVPPMTAQYISLVKNSSLGVAIGYPELFNLTNSISTLSGQAIECVALMALMYLLTAITMSALANGFNRMTRITER